MNKVVQFSTPGVLDLRAIKVFGMSVKVKDNPIGYFGTGLKYAIAVILREGGRVVIMSKDYSVDFTTKTTQFRGAEINTIFMSSLNSDDKLVQEELPFTMDLGKNWQMWQAYRELHCNTLDEDGCVDVVDEDEDDTRNISENTYILVMSKEFQECYNTRNTIILEKYLAYEGDGCNIIDSRAGNGYYRSVRVIDLEKPSQFTYDVTSKLDLTEDRTIKYVFEFKSIITRSLMSCTDKNILTRVLGAPTRDTFEGSIDFDCGYSMSQEFIDTVLNLKATNNPCLNLSAIKAVAKTRGLVPYTEFVLSVRELSMISKARQFLKKSNIDVYKFETIFVESLHRGPGAYGLAADNKIYISRECFVKGTKYLTSTLYEEYTHIVTGYNDECRQMQTHLFDTIISLMEDLQGEAL